MEPWSLIASISEARISPMLDHKLVEVAGTTVTVATALSALVVIVTTVWLSKLMRRAILRVFARRGLDAEKSAGTIVALLHYLILATGFGVALDTVGIDLGALFAAGAIFAIGIGFAMQNIIQNFVSGVILLTERAIKPGDVLEIQGAVCRVLRLGIRAAVVQTRDGEDLIVPNSLLSQATVKNFTLEADAYRLRVSVGVTYGSNMKQVRTLLEEAAVDYPWQVAGRPSQVILVDFGNNSVVWEVAVWTRDAWTARRAESEVRERIWDAFQANGVVIAFPQLDVHFDPEVAAGFSHMASSAAAKRPAASA